LFVWLRAKVIQLHVSCLKFKPRFCKLIKPACFIDAQRISYETNPTARFGSSAVVFENNRGASFFFLV
jgi:hypothetical protein